MVWQILLLIVYNLALSVVFIFSLCQAYLIFSFLQSKRKKEQAPQMPKDLPIITIQLPLFNELYVVERLINAICALNYPQSKLEIQVLDDSKDEALALSKKIIEQKKALGFDIVHITREQNIGFKAGALQNGLAKAKGEFIAVFDADFLPEPDFLRQLISYFNQANIGMVQSRWGHINQNYSLLTRLQAFGLDGHFTIEQSGRNNAGLFINFNGTAGIWRKSCIEDAGGWQHDTLTEDLDLSYRAQLKGWQFKYVEDLICPAELPVEINAFRSQQHRWTKGAIETAKKLFRQMWLSNITFKKKIFAAFHLLNAYIFLFVFITSVLSLPVLIVKNQGQIPIIYFQWMSFFLIGLVIVYAFYLVSFTTRKEKILEFLKLFPLFLSVSMALSFHNSLAVLEGIFGKKSAFIRTPKFNITQNKQDFKANIYFNHRLSKTFFIELFLGFYFLGGVLMAFYFKDYGLMPFHLLLCIGFGILNFYALKSRLA
jgi:cellulose synthase/poly-beta-1,6-N-acetylglucosamine synthase-like glycosyltransferase